MKYFFTFIFALFSLGNSFAQKKADSLKNDWLNKSLHDSIRLESMRTLITDHYLQTKTDSALILANNMLEYTLKNNYIRCEIDAQTIIGEIYFEQDKFDIGTESYTKGLELAKTISDSTIYSNKLFELGVLYYDNEDYVNAFKTFKKSQELCRIVGDSLNEGWSAGYLGLLFKALGDYKESEKYHLEHLRLSTKYGIKRSISGANGNLGGVYDDMGNITKSIKHWKGAIKLAKELGLEAYGSIGTLNLISIYINEKDFSNAKNQLDEYIGVTKEFDQPRYRQNIELFKCQIEYGLGNYTSALQRCESCLKMLENSENEYVEKNLYNTLYQINKKLNRQNEALDYFEKYQVVMDDEKEDNARTEIQNIVFTNQIVADSIAQAQEKELLNITYEEGIREKNQEKNLLLIIGIFVIILIVSYFLVSKRMAVAEGNKLKEVNELKNTLFTNITHEFRTPLTVIKGMTDTLKSNIENRELDDVEISFEMIQRNSDGLLNLVNEMLDLAKLESGNMELRLEQADVIPFLKYVSESFESFADEHQIKLTIYSEIDSLIMDFDANKLTSVITNLLSNAFKFTSEFGKIIVHITQTTQNGKPYLFVKVKDNGIGIDEKKLPNVFNRFYQADASTIRENEGTGIGLSITKELVDLMNGTIRANSTLGTGSEFSFTIPVTRNAPKKDNVQIDNIAHPELTAIPFIQTEEVTDIATNLPLVLIIEDNQDVAHYLKSCLKDKYETLYAPNGIKGIELAFDKIPDIIISDVMMPGKDGYEVCKTLKSDERTDHIPIIILTAKTSFEDKLKGLSYGADAYLSKPFVKEELFIRLDQLVAIRKNLISKIQKEDSGILLRKKTRNPKLHFLKKIIKLIHKDIGNSQFGSEKLAENLLISESQIYRKIKAITGKSTAVYIRSVRLQYAKELLVHSDKTVSEVAFDVGFNDPSWFSRSFKNEFGHSPSDVSK